MNDGIMLAFYVPQELAQEIALEGGHTPEELHLTLAYLGDKGQVQGLEGLAYVAREVAGSHLPISGRIDGIARFCHTNDEEGRDALVLLVNAPALSGFREQLVNRVFEGGYKVDMENGFTPHITLKYLAPNEQAPVQRVEKEIPIEFDRLTLAVGDEQYQYEFEETRESIKRMETNVKEFTRPVPGASLITKRANFATVGDHTIMVDPGTKFNLIRVDRLSGNIAMYKLRGEDGDIYSMPATAFGHPAYKESVQRPEITVRDVKQWQHYPLGKHISIDGRFVGRIYSPRMDGKWKVQAPALRWSATRTFSSIEQALQALISAWQHERKLMGESTMQEQAYVNGAPSPRLKKADLPKFAPTILKIVKLTMSGKRQMSLQDLHRLTGYNTDDLEYILKRSGDKIGVTVSGNIVRWKGLKGRGI